MEPDEKRTVRLDANKMAHGLAVGVVATLYAVGPALEAIQPSCDTPRDLCGNIAPLPIDGQHKAPKPGSRQVIKLIAESSAAATPVGANSVSIRRGGS